MVKGETEIAGQVQRAFDASYDAKAADSFFVQLFSAAQKAGKRVRSETSIDRGHTSLASSAVYLAKRIAGNLKGKTVLIAGAGETGTLVATYMQQEQADIFIANRTYERAEALSLKIGGKAVPFDKISNFLSKADVVITATDAGKDIITYSEVKKAQKNRDGKIFVLVDISLPRNINPKVKELNNVFLSAMDDIKEIVKSTVERRKDEMIKAEKIIDEELKQFIKQQKILTAAPLIANLREKFENIRKSELEKYAHVLSEGDLKTMDRLTARIVNKMLHPPTLWIKKAASESTGAADKTQWIKELFDLDSGFKNNKKI
jgi:glutamyl-tRNA reductase